MAKTIVQKIGPLYGEPINGTVFGQPNGSEALPPINRIYLFSKKFNPLYIKNNGNFVDTCNSSGTAGTGAYFATELRFNEKYDIKIEVSDTDTFANILTSNMQGSINYISARNDIGLYGCGYSSDLTVASGTTYYVRMSVVFLGNVVCTSEAVAVVGYV